MRRGTVKTVPSHYFLGLGIGGQKGGSRTAPKPVCFQREKFRLCLCQFALNVISQTTSFDPEETLLRVGLARLALRFMRDMVRTAVS